MKQYKINKDKPKLSDEQISRHKDFAGLMSSYQDVTQNRHKVPLYKNKKLFLLLILIALVAWIIGSSEDSAPTVPEQPPVELNEVE